jgi:cytochrome c-type biogenesis protein CcmH
MGRGHANSGEPADLRVYKDQLAEVDRDLQRGVIVPAEADRIRTDVSRRLLAADEKSAGSVTTRGPTGLVMAVVVGAMLIGAFAIYDRLGAPGYPDMPMASRIADADVARRNRPSQAQAEAALPLPDAPQVDAELDELMIRLRAAVKDRPDDLQGQTFLAQYEGQIGNYRAASVAQSNVIRLKGDQATANDQALLADLLIRATSGYVSPEAEAALTATLRLDPQNGMARYYSGLLLAQTGRPDLAFNLWRGLLETSPPDAAWMPPLLAEIQGLADLAGVDFALPEAVGSQPPEPDAEAVANAAGMSEADRMSMIGGMVEQLSDRLATSGGTGAEWARLITSLGVLGETDRAKAIWDEAKGVFSASPGDLALLQQAATAAGIAE